MRKILSIPLLSLLIAMSCNRAKLDDAEKKEVRGEFYELLKSTTRAYQNGNIDRMLNYSKELLSSAQSLNNDSFLTVSYRLLGNSYFLRDNYVSAIEYYNRGIALCEAKPGEMDTLLPDLYNNIGFNYNKLGSYGNALEYLKKAESVVTRNVSRRPYAYIYENLALTYLYQDQPITAGHYLKLAEEVNRTAKDNYIQASINIDYGRIHSKLLEENGPSNDDESQSINSFRRAISFADSLRDLKHLSSAFLEFGDFFFQQNKNDSALFYVNRSLDTSQRYKYRDNIVKSAGLLQKIYDRQGNKVKAYQYAVLRNDSANSLVKLNDLDQLMSLTFNAQMRQKELDAKEKLERESRSRNIQCTLIAILILTGVIALLIVTRRKKVRPGFINFVGGLGLLIVFEFVNLVIHPLIEEYTHRSAFGMLLILVAIASVLLPLHHKVEHYVREKLLTNNEKLGRNRRDDQNLDAPIY